MEKETKKKCDMTEANSSVWGKFDKVTPYCAPVGFMEFKSQMSCAREVMQSLRNDNINFIRICGRSGIGKTTMAKHIAMRAKKENLFDEIVMADVSGSTNLRNIQDQIAEMLGLELEDETLLGIATPLHRRLANCKRILFVLDNVSGVFDGVDLEAIGIPSGGKSRGCKVVLTSEKQYICNKMGAQKNITVKLLTKEEAWLLFKEAAGNSIDAPDIQPIAEQVVNECEGLPLTLIVIGRALKNKSKFVWTDALQHLRFASVIRAGRCRRLLGGGGETDTSRRLQLSYNYLEDDEAKYLFLLCCLYPVNCDIHIENLVRCGMGLRLFKDINGLEEARNRVRSLVDQLKNCYLLLHSDEAENEHVKMHDLLHSFGQSIARAGENAFLIKHGDSLRKWPFDYYKPEDQKYHVLEKYTSISVISGNIIELPKGLRYPKLRMLLLGCMNNSLKAPNNFFEGMKELQVLNLELSIPLLPSSLQFLRNLHTLTLYLQNYKLENITAIRELLNLEILSFHAPYIKVLPDEIGRLSNLMLLDLTGCNRLERISPGVISGLVRLQELYMIGSFSNWEADKGEGKEGGRNASLRELQSLFDLKILDIYIPDAALLPRDPLFADLTKYKIRIGDNDCWNGFPFQKHLLWKLDKGIDLHAGICMLLNCTELLSLKGKGSRNVVHELVQDGVQHLKDLSIESCDTLMCLADARDLSLDSSAAIFPILESLKLDNLSRLKEICHGQLPAGSFGKLRTLTLRILPSLTHLLVEDLQTTVSLHNLRYVEIDRCNRLGNLFSLSMASGLVQLQELRISHCEMMEEIIWEGRGEDGHITNKIAFPCLEHMELTHLEGLIAFSRGIDKIEFPLLKTLHINYLSKVKSFFPNENTLHSDENLNATLQSIFPQQVAFPSLEELELVGLPNVSDLWCSELSTGTFCKLRCLKVKDCHGLVRNVFPAHILKMSPNLEEVELYNCDSVEEVFGGPQGIPFANIRTLIVRNCDSLRNLFSPSIVRGLIHLQELTIDCCPTMEEVIWEGRGDDGHATNKIEFPRLEYMELTQLDSLTSFSRGIDKIEFPQLKKLHIKCLPNVESFFPNESTLHSDDNCNATMHSIFHQKVAFPSLEELELIDLPNVRNMFSPSIARCFVHLQELMIYDCSAMEAVVANEDVEQEGGERIYGTLFPQLEDLERSKTSEDEEEQEREMIYVTLFPQLKCLELRKLPSLERFCHTNYDWKMPSLHRLEVFDCPEMQTFSPGFVHAPGLDDVMVAGDRVWETKDLNRAIQHFFEKQEVEEERGDEREEDKNEDNKGQEVKEERGDKRKADKMRTKKKKKKKKSIKQGRENEREGDKNEDNKGQEVEEERGNKQEANKNEDNKEEEEEEHQGQEVEEERGDKREADKMRTKKKKKKSIKQGRENEREEDKNEDNKGHEVEEERGDKQEADKNEDNKEEEEHQGQEVEEERGDKQEANKMRTKKKKKKSIKGFNVSARSRGRKRR